MMPHTKVFFSENHGLFCKDTQVEVGHKNVKIFYFISKNLFNVYMNKCTIFGLILPATSQMANDWEELDGEGGGTHRLMHL